MPEAPRAIWDAVASENHLPFHLQARGEFEFVKAKPLGDGFVGVPVYEGSRSGASAIPGESDVDRREFPDCQRVYRSKPPRHFLRSQLHAPSSALWAFR